MTVPNVVRHADGTGNWMESYHLLFDYSVARDATAKAVTRSLVAVVTALLEKRRKFRETRDFAQADDIRATLENCGVEVRDAEGATHWRVGFVTVGRVA